MVCEGLLSVSFDAGGFLVSSEGVKVTHGSTLVILEWDAETNFNTLKCTLGGTLKGMLRKVKTGVP